MTPTVQQVVEFAKRVPGFNVLPQDDQLILIKVHRWYHAVFEGIEHVSGRCELKRCEVDSAQLYMQMCMSRMQMYNFVTKIKSESMLWEQYIRSSGSSRCGCLVWAGSPRRLPSYSMTGTPSTKRSSSLCMMWVYNFPESFLWQCRLYIAALLLDPVREVDAGVHSSH